MVTGKAGALGDSVTITREKNKITVTSDGLCRLDILWFLIHLNYIYDLVFVFYHLPTCCYSNQTLPFVVFSLESLKHERR